MNALLLAALLVAPAMALDLEQEAVPFDPWDQLLLEEAPVEEEEVEQHQLMPLGGGYGISGQPAIREQLFAPVETVPTYEPMPGEIGGSGLAEPLFYEEAQE